MEVRQTVKKKNFSDSEIKVILSHVQKNKSVLFGSAKSGVRSWQKTAAWKEIATAVNIIGVDRRSHSEVKKKWSDLKISAKKRFAAIKEIKEQSIQRRPEPILALTDIEEQVLAITSSDLVPHGGGDTEGAPLSNTDAAEEVPATSVWPSDTPTTLELTRCKTEPEPCNSNDSPAPGLPPWILSSEIPDKQTDICQAMAEINRSLLAINDTLKEINENLKRTSNQ